MYCNNNEFHKNYLQMKSLNNIRNAEGKRWSKAKTYITRLDYIKSADAIDNLAEIFITDGTALISNGEILNRLKL